MSRPQEITSQGEIPLTGEIPRRVGAARQLARICRWTFFDPIQVRRLVEATGSGMRVRWVWCGFAAGFGGLLSPLAGATDLPGVFVLPAIAAIDLHSEGVDSLGVMAVSVLFFLSPAVGWTPGKSSSSDPWFWTPMFFMALGFGGLLSWTAMNRSFLFLTIGLAALSITSPSKSLAANLAASSDADAARFEAACLLLVLLAVRMAGPQALIGSFKATANSETCHALSLTRFRRCLVLAYVSFSAAFTIVHLLLPSPRLELLAAVLLVVAVLELDLPAYLRLVLWLRRQDGALRSFSRELLFFSLPVLAFEPAGLKSYLSRVRELEGPEVAGELAVELLLRTGYRRDAESTIEEIGKDEPFLFYQLRQRLAAEVPRDPDEQQTTAPRPAVRESATLLAPALSAISARETSASEIQGMLLSHPYQPPRGKEGAPLAALAIWFPIASWPRETLSLPQVVYRTLASVREPFRRTKILLADAERVRSTYTHLLASSVRWAEANLGASLIPVALSLERLAGNASILETLARRLKEARKQEGASSESLLDACREILRLGLTLPAADATELAIALSAGNAWILLEDDREMETELKPVQRAFDAVLLCYLTNLEELIVVR